MKIGILTHYDVNNQGAQLQMYALYNKLIEMGHTPKILTYNKNYDFRMDEKKRNQVSIKSIPYYIQNYLLKKGFGLTLHNIKKYIINRNFRLHTFTYENYATANIDMAIIGSDEVFSLECGVNIMMYGHAVNTDNLISYAPSFGQTDIDILNKYHCHDLISSGLSKFQAISARDENTAKIIEKLISKNPKIVCDPVLLYDFSKIYVNVKKPKKKYLIVYSYDRHMIKKDEINAIKSYARSHSLITVSPGTFHKWCDKNIVCNCVEWLEIFKGAEAVITDTFHGTIVSAITNVPVAVYVRDQINANKLTDLVSRLNIESRHLKAITKENIERIFNERMDFDLLNSNIDTMRNEGSHYLVRAISKCQNGDI